VTGLAALVLAHHPLFRDGPFRGRSEQRVHALFELILASAVARVSDPRRGGAVCRISRACRQPRASPWDLPAADGAERVQCPASGRCRSRGGRHGCRCRRRRGILLMLSSLRASDSHPGAEAGNNSAREMARIRATASPRRCTWSFSHSCDVVLDRRSFDSQPAGRSACSRAAIDQMRDLQLRAATAAWCGVAVTDGVVATLRQHRHVALQRRGSSW